MPENNIYDDVYQTRIHDYIPSNSSWTVVADLCANDHNNSLNRNEVSAAGVPGTSCDMIRTPRP
jgi:hypothetical protein